jgi:hypothetical protein
VGLIGFFAAACIGAASIVSRSHGEVAKQVTISSPAEASPLSAQPSPADVQASISKATSPESALPAPPAHTPLAGSAQTAVAPSTEQEQLVPLLRGFLAVVEQDIEELKTSIEQLKTSQEQMVGSNSAVAEQLKTSQEQMARDNAAVAEQLKATQEQLARLVAKDSEPQPPLKTSAPQPRSIPTGKPMSKLSSSQTRAQPLPLRGRPE